jgi:arsenate reductase
VTLTIYHNPRCSKSRETLALLESKGQAPQIIEYLKTPPSAAELKRILKALGLTAKDIVRKKEAAEVKIDAAKMTEQELIAAMIKHPEIIERPIVVNGEKAAMGRPPERVLTIL